MLMERIGVEETLPFRVAVLWPGLTPEEVRVPRASEALHLGLFDATERVGVGSLYRDGEAARIRKLAGADGRLGAGLGGRLLIALLDTARVEGAASVWLDARGRARRFYEPYGFAMEGEPFEKSGLPYLPMRVTPRP